MTDDETPLERARRLIEEDQERVFAMIKRDKKERVRERDRKAAEIDLSNGKTVSIADAVIEPTPEWLERGDVETFTPKLEDRTVKTVKAYRRVSTPIIMRMWKSDKLTDDQAKACIWYRLVHARAGLEGRYSSNYQSLFRSSVQVKSVNLIAGHIPMTLEEAEARRHYRSARACLSDFDAKLFESVVIMDMGVKELARALKWRDEKVFPKFRELAQVIADFCEDAEIDVQPGSAIDRP